jgi:hypothetical protein
MRAGDAWGEWVDAGGAQAIQLGQALLLEFV